LDLLGLGVADIGEFVGVLEGVGRELAADFLEAFDQGAIAFPVLRDLWRIGHIVEVHGEELIVELAMLELMLQSSISLSGALASDALVSHMELVVTRVDDLGRLLRVLVQGLLVVVRSLLKKSLGERGRILADALEISDGLIQPAKVAELLDWRSSRLLLDSLILLFKCLDAEIVRI